jgi:hypothetical protein
MAQIEMRMDSRDLETILIPSVRVSLFNEIDAKSGKIECARYVSSNDLLFLPDAQRTIADDAVSLAPAKSIQHNSTRFAIPDPPSAMMVARQQAALYNAPTSVSSTPRVHGYSFVKATPSPAPGQDNINPDDFMTWGEIESTPLSVRDDGPQFTLPAVPRRQVIASKLQDQASRSFRKRTGSERRGTGGESPGTWGNTPGGTVQQGNSVRAAAMSPAASLLLSKLNKEKAGSSIMTGAAGSFKRMTSYPTATSSATPVEVVVNKKRRTDMPKDVDVDTSGLMKF